MRVSTRIGGGVLSMCFLVLISACSTTQKTTQSLRTPTEQLLHSEAITRSLNQGVQTHLLIPQGAKITVNATGLSPDSPFVGDIVSGWLGNQGYLLESPENATYRVNVVVNSLGTEFDETFFGIPPISSALIPIATPELAFYKSQNQVGYSNFYLDIFEQSSGKLVHTTPRYLAETFYNDYTIFLLFNYSKTDLVDPPKSRSLSRIVE